MDYKKVPETEMQNFDPVVDYKPPPKPFDDRDDEKERRNKAKEKRISISLIILTFVASVCVLFGTLYPELSRGEINMVPWRAALQGTGRLQPFLIRDRITLVNLGLWRYCYDDQLYDLIELVNPQFNNMGRKKRDADEEEEEIHDIEKRQTVEGDISVRCHNVPKPWKMPYHVKNKTEATKYCLIIGIVCCILSFLISILVLITRLPLLKLAQLATCFLGALAGVIAIGLQLSMSLNEKNVEMMTQKAYTKTMSALIIENALGQDTAHFVYGIITKRRFTKIEGQFGVCSLIILCYTVISVINFLLAEIHRHIISK